MTSACNILVRIWPLAVSRARLEVLRAWLSVEEQARAARFLVRSAADEFVIGRGIAREVLARECACRPSELIFQVSAHGQPSLQHPIGALSFSLSHSAGVCALATTVGRLVGVDIERIAGIERDMAQACFTAREAALLDTMPSQERTRAFFRSWVAKEAYLKATGKGLAGGLDSLELKVDAGTKIEPMALCGSAAEALAWRFASFYAAPSVVGAVAARTDGLPLELSLRHIDPECPVGSA